MIITTIAYLHGAGGAERQIVMLSNEMVIRGHEVHMIVLNEFNAPYPISDKVIVHDLSGRDKGKWAVFKRFLAFREIIKKIKPNITISYNLQGAYFSLLEGKSVCGKILYSERGDPYDKEYSGLLGKVRDYTCRHVDAMVFQSEGAKEFFTIGKRQKTIVIHNSVTVPQNKYPIAEKRDNRIVTVGRLHPQKNPYLLLDAFTMIAPKYPSIRLDFYGDGEMHDELQDKINYLGLEHRVTLHPSTKDIFDCIRTAQLFVLSSDYEGMPNALMEAMALGLPCISTDCRPGGARTLIDNGQNGLIVPVKDVDTLAETMMFVLDNPDLAEDMAQEARLLGETHTNKIIFDKWNDFLKSLYQTI